MRAMLFLVAAIGVAQSGAAQAQTAKNTPESIVCAMTGSCDAPVADPGRVPVGGEKAFSLARPSSAAPTRSTPSLALRPMTPSPARMVRGSTAPARVRPGGGVDMLVSFSKGSAVMTPQAQNEARAFAKAMAAPQMAGLSFRIEGHTDSSGTRQKNIDLSQQRAQSVVDYLVRQGVDASRLSARGFGPDKPISGKSASAPANRRVEFVKSN